MKTYTRQELIKITPDQLKAMSEEEKANVRAQERAFLDADTIDDSV